MTTLAAKLIEVREAVGGYITKAGRNTAQSYSFVSEADVTEKVYPEFGKRGIIFYPAARKVVEVREYTTAKGSTMFMTTTEAIWVATDGTEEVRVMTIGQGADTGDKGAYKGMAGDKKYAIMQLLGIATGDDPEETRRDELSEAKTYEPKVPGMTADAVKAQVKTNTAAIQATMKDEMTDAQRGKMFGMLADAGLDTGDKDDRAVIKRIVYEASGKMSSKQLLQSDMDAVYTGIREFMDEANDAKAVDANAVFDAIVGITRGELVPESKVTA